MGYIVRKQVTEESADGYVVTTIFEEHKEYTLEELFVMIHEKLGEREPDE